MDLIYIIGPAGAGKSTLTNALMYYVTGYNPEITAITINLDPAVRELPYIPDIDIRDYITVDQVIEETGLGPNGAIIEAADRIIDYIEDIKMEIEEYNDPEYVFIDTPGQMELFSFRNTGPMIANTLGYADAHMGIIFCYDSKIATRPNGLISTLLLATSVQYRFPNIPLICVLNKQDLVPIEKLDRILEWMENEDELENAINKYERGMLRELTIVLQRTFKEFDAFSRLIPISAKYNKNIDNIYAELQRLFDEYESPFL